jgi:hypothetical protein
MSVKDGIFVTNQVQLSQPLDAATVARAKEIRWQWTLLYNRLKAAPWNEATDAHLARCTEVIDLIDSILAANPTVN